MSPTDIDALARALLQARATRTPLSFADSDESSRARLPVNRAEAYAVQAATWRLTQGARRPSAWKIGISADSNIPVRAAMPTIVPSGAQLPRAAFRLVGLECEIAVRFGRPLPPRPQPYAQAEVLEALDAAFVAIEIVDSALADPAAAGPFLRLADSMLHGSFVLGERLAAWPDLARHWHQLRPHSRIDDAPVGPSAGRHPLGDPLSQLAWWANVGALNWGGVQAGDILTTGTWNGMHFAEQPARFEACFTHTDGHTLGNASVAFT